MIEEYDKLNIGDQSRDGQVEIVDKDRLCYLVKNVSNGACGIRTISKKILGEFIAYFKIHPHNTAMQARNELSGTSDVDKYEYGYSSTLYKMAKMVINCKEECLFAPQSQSHVKITKSFDNLPLQQIFFGAPGTGKSFFIKEYTKGASVIRTTFHPDSDYSTFVGAYKPTIVR